MSHLGRASPLAASRGADIWHGQHANLDCFRATSVNECADRRHDEVPIPVPLLIGPSGIAERMTAAGVGVQAEADRLRTICVDGPSFFGQRHSKNE